VKKIREFIEKHLSFITLEFPSTVTSAQTNAGCTTTSQANESRHIYTTSSQANTLRHATSKTNTLMHSLTNHSVLSYANEVLIMSILIPLRRGMGTEYSGVGGTCSYFLKFLIRQRAKLKLIIYLHTTSICSVKGCALWSHTVNVHGKPGKNIPMDLHMEHLNRDLASHYARSISSKSRKGFKDFNRNTTSF